MNQKIQLVVNSVPCGTCDSIKGEFCVYLVNNKPIPYTADVHTIRLATYAQLQLKIARYKKQQEHRWRLT